MFCALMPAAKVLANNAAIDNIAPARLIIDEFREKRLFLVFMSALPILDFINK